MFEDYFPLIPQWGGDKNLEKEFIEAARTALSVMDQKSVETLGSSRSVKIPNSSGSPSPGHGDLFNNNMNSELEYEHNS